MAQHARERGTGVHIHVAETKGEWEWCQSTHGMTPVGWLESLGVLDVSTLAAHSVWLDDADIAIYAKHGVAAAHNPISNLKLASGVCRVEDLQRAGVTVGLGTDGSSSNNIMSMHRELQVAALIHKIRNYDAQVVGARDALKLATIEGAKAIRWQDAIGSIAEGKKADLTLYKLDAPWNVPHHDVVSNLAYAAQQSDIDSVFVQGECLYKHGDYTTLDKERILAEAETRAKRLIQ